MKHGYYNMEHGLTIDLIMGPSQKVALITRIEVHRNHRGMGYASEGMQRVLEDADEEGVALLLSIEPDGTGLNAVQLRAWYERMGFKPLGTIREETDTAMFRLPQGQRNDPTALETFDTSDLRAELLPPREM